MTFTRLVGGAALLLSLSPSDAQSQSRPTGPPITAWVAREGPKQRFQDTPAADQGWDRVRRLKPGTRVEVTVRGSQPLERLVVFATESELVLTPSREALRTETIRRTDVLAITRTVSHAARDTLIGLATGIGIGAALGCTRGSDGYVEICRGMTLVFGGLGTGVGAAIGSGRYATDVIYQVSEP